MFVVVDGTPSIGKDIMVGNGQLGSQQMKPVQTMPGTLSQSGAVFKTANGKTSVNGDAVAASASNASATGAAMETRSSTAALALAIMAILSMVLGG
jgi:hypothetical protein